MMMMKSVFWWRKPEYPEETIDLRQVTDARRLQARTPGPIREAQEGSPPQVTRSLFFKAPGHQVTFFHEKIKTTQVTGRFFKLSRSRGRPQNGPRSQVAKNPSWASYVGWSGNWGLSLYFEVADQGFNERESSVNFHLGATFLPYSVHDWR